MIVCPIDNVSRTSECICYFLPPAAVVGLKNYSVSEDISDVEVCAIVESPNNTECPVSFPFIISLSVNNNSAGSILSLCLYIYTQYLRFFPHIFLQLLPWIIIFLLS